MDDLHAYVNPKNGLHQPMISDEIYEIVKKHSDVRQLSIKIVNTKFFIAAAEFCHHLRQRFSISILWF